ncbi:MAG: hypothetical protein D6819_10880 [Gammaproteobacteria bacterium]|nr:MAG: hypothetical protein D6819_10880 [Gammaproteobacteria bacterium]
MPKRLLSPKAWKTRLTFWGGAFAVGLGAALLAVGSDAALGAFRAILHHHSLWPFLLTPLGLPAACGLAVVAVGHLSGAHLWHGL